MKTILITIGLLAAVGLVIFSYAVEVANVSLDLEGNIVEEAESLGDDPDNTP
jgi:hypothetical protein